MLLCAVSCGALLQTFHRFPKQNILLTVFFARESAQKRATVRICDQILQTFRPACYRFISVQTRVHSWIPTVRSLELNSVFKNEGSSSIISEWVHHELHLWFLRYISSNWPWKCTFRIKKSSAMKFSSNSKLPGRNFVPTKQKLLSIYQM